MFQKWVAKRTIQGLIDEGDVMSSQTQSTTLNAIQMWFSRSIDIVRQLLEDDEHHLVNQLKSLAYDFPAMGTDPVLKPKEIERYVSHIGRFQDQLRQCLVEIKRDGLVKHRIKQSQALSIAVVTVILTLLGHWGFNALWGTDSNSSELLQEEQYRVTGVNYSNWYNNLRSDYRSGLDSISAKFESSLTINRILHDWTNSFKTNTKHRIDSFIMEYSVQGGDTMKLNRERWPIGKVNYKPVDPRGRK